MARINAENEFLCDPRLQLLSTQMPRWEAIGSVICMWEVGQSYWKKNKSLIPKNIFSIMHRSKEILSVGLAELKENGVYCKGAEDRWGFLLSNSIAGKKGGTKRAETAKRDEMGHFLPQKQEKYPVEHPDEPQSAKHSSSSSSSSSFCKRLINIPLTTEKDVLASKLSEIYNKYPRKEGKKQGLVKLVSVVMKDPAALEKIDRAVENYKKMVSFEKRDRQYIKQFSTFANNWEDYLEISVTNKKMPRELSFDVQD